MARVVDFEATKGSNWSQVNLAVPRLGDREIANADYAALVESKGDRSLAFWPQVSTRNDFSPLGNGSRMDEAHEWLSANATGPWAWHESWSNNGHSLNVHVYLERIPDRKAFVAAFDEFQVASERDDLEDLEGVAVLRGVLPAMGETESLTVWTGRRHGFEASEPDGPEGPLRVEFTVPEMGEAFAAAWGDRVPLRKDGSWLIPVDLRNRAFSWIYRNMPVDGPSGAPTPEDGYRWTFAIRYPSIAREFERDWGAHFTKDANGDYVADDLPDPKEREVPADFAAYVRGERDDYASPYAEAESTSAPVARGI